MESWEVLEQAIPKKASDRVAQILGVGGDYVRKWRREPESDDAPTATGQRSILDRICLLVDAVFLVNPTGTGLIVEHISAHHDELLATHAKAIPCRKTQAATGATLLTEAVEAVNSINLNGCTADTLRELVELRDAANTAIKQVEITMSEPGASGVPARASLSGVPVATGFLATTEDSSLWK